MKLLCNNFCLHHIREKNKEDLNIIWITENLSQKLYSQNQSNPKHYIQKAKKQMGPQSLQSASGGNQYITLQDPYPELYQVTLTKLSKAFLFKDNI